MGGSVSSPMLERDSCAGYKCTRCNRSIDVTYSRDCKHCIEDLTNIKKKQEREFYQLQFEQQREAERKAHLKNLQIQSEIQERLRKQKEEEFDELKRQLRFAQIAADFQEQSRLRAVENMARLHAMTPEERNQQKIAIDLETAERKKQRRLFKESEDARMERWRRQQAQEDARERLKNEKTFCFGCFM